MAATENYENKLGLEIPVALIFYANVLTGSLTTNLIIFRTCYVTLAYNRTECELLGSVQPSENSAQLEEMVEPLASKIIMASGMIQCLLDGIMCLVLGPWSDKFGRRPLLLASSLSFIVAYAFKATFAYFDNLSGWFYLICILPTCLTGGIPGFVLIAICYIADTISESNRGLRNGLIEASVMLGVLSGNLSCAPLFDLLGYAYVYSACAILCLLTLLYVFVYIPEAIEPPQLSGQIRELFKIDFINDILCAATKSRLHYHRAIILMVVTILVILLMCTQGNMTLMFLYVREKFQWSLQTYTWYSCIQNIFWFTATLCGVYLLHKILNIPETVLILLGLISLINGSLVRGMATTPLTIYLSAMFECLGSNVSPLGRSILSKVVPHNEVGKIFALLAASESLIGIFGSPIYTLIYNKTILTDPGAYNFFSAGIYSIGVILAASTMVLLFLRQDGATDLAIFEDKSETKSTKDLTNPIEVITTYQTEITYSITG